MTSPTVLVVDDDPDFVEIMRTILQSEAYRVVTAANGVQALRAVREYQPDLMILDIMMSSVLDGYNVSQALADDPDLRYLPIIMVSSIANTPQAEIFPLEERLHTDAFLTKPVNPRELLNKVKDLLL